jgi:deoxycytidine triphosphate deaminase
MSDLVSENELKNLVKAGKVIESGVTSSVEGVKYDFRLGKRILLPGQQPIDITQLPEQDRAKLFLNPGSLAYVLTEERLALPDNMKAELSLKRKMSHAGILVLGGFCVDPGYTGRLLFGLFNFSTSPFPIEPGRKLIAAQFYRLAQAEVPPSRHQDIIDEFPDDLVRFMQSYEPVILSGVKADIAELRQALAALREDFITKEKWFAEFREFLERHEKQIERLTEGLKLESETRQKTQDEFRKDLKDVSRSALFTSVTVGVLSALVVGIVASIVAAVLFARWAH